MSALIRMSLTCSSHQSIWPGSPSGGVHRRGRRTTRSGRESRLPVPASISEAMRYPLATRSRCVRRGLGARCRKGVSQHATSSAIRTSVRSASSPAVYPHRRASASPELACRRPAVVLVVGTHLFGALNAPAVSCDDAAYSSSTRGVVLWACKPPVEVREAAFSCEQSEQ